MRESTVHKQFCFADQPAACQGYFANDTLPCVCGVKGDVLSAVSQVTIPIVPLAQDAPEIHLMPLSA